MALGRPIVKWGWLAFTLVAGAGSFALYRHLRAFGEHEIDYWTQVGYGVAGTMFILWVFAFPIRKRLILRLYGTIWKPRVSDEEHQFELARLKIMDLQKDVDHGRLKDPKDIMERATRIMADAGAERAFTPELHYKPKSEDPSRTPQIKLIRKQALGRLELWLASHDWLALLAFFVILLHADFHPGGPLSMALLGAFAVVVATGLWGQLRYKLNPRGLTERERPDIYFEETHHLADRLSEELDKAFAKGSKDLRAALGRLVGADLSGGKGRKLIEATELEVAKLGDQNERLKASLFILRLQQSSRVRGWLDPQVATKRKLDRWLLLHIPFATAMLVLMLVHVAVVVWY